MGRALKDIYIYYIYVGIGNWTQRRETHQVRTQEGLTD